MNIIGHFFKFLFGQEKQFGVGNKTIYRVPLTKDITGFYAGKQGETLYLLALTHNKDKALRFVESRTKDGKAGLTVRDIFGRATGKIMEMYSGHQPIWFPAIIQAEKDAMHPDNGGKNFQRLPGFEEGVPVDVQEIIRDAKLVAAGKPIDSVLSEALCDALDDLQQAEVKDGGTVFVLPDAQTWEAWMVSRIVESIFMSQPLHYELASDMKIFGDIVLANVQNAK